MSRLLTQCHQWGKDKSTTKTNTFGPLSPKTKLRNWVMNELYGERDHDWDDAHIFVVFL